MIRSLALASLVTAALMGTPAAVSADPATACTGTLTGGTYGFLSVPDGASCTLDGVTVTGSIKVGADSSLYTDQSSVGKHVRARGANTVQLIDTDVLGQIHVWETTGLVVIGADGCRADPVAGGNIHLHDNHGNIAICQMSIRNNLLVQDNESHRIGLFDNTVGVNFKLSGNTGDAFRFRSNTVEGNAIVNHNTVATLLLVRGNHIGNNLICHRNIGHLVDDTDTVLGQFIGQCSA